MSCTSPLPSGLLCDVEGKAVTSIFSSFIIPNGSSTFSCLMLPSCCKHTSMGSDLTGTWSLRLVWASDEGVTGVFFWKKWLRVFTSFLRPFCLAALPLIIITGVSGEIGGDSKFEWHNFCLVRWERLYLVYFKN